MEGRPERLADYFVVVGVGSDNVSKFKPFSSEEGVALPADQQQDSSVQEPVTDIAVFYSKHEQLPKGYRVIETTPQGHSANLTGGSLFSSGPVYISYKKGKDKPPIVDIGVFHANQNQSPPVGHEALAFSIGGRSADLNKSGRGQSYLTFKRGLIQAHNNAITDLCIVATNKGEDPPSCFKLLRSLDLSKGLVGNTLHLCYRTSQVRPPSVAYTPELLSRYPSEDHPEFPLPHSVPLFCLPFGVSVEHWDRHTPFPFPTFSTFALTNAQGQCMYGSVVVFYETITEHSCGKEMRAELNIPDEEPLHMSKCICLLSHWPFFSSFKAFLSALYRLSISHNTSLPLERYVGNLMLEVPFPTLVRPRIQMHIGSESIVFSLPVQTPLPLSVSTHWSLLSSLDPDNCLTLLTLTLLEQKLVLHSSRPALLTCVGEALRSILFPFSWQCTYIPLCPLAFSSYMQAPVPFIIGIDSRFFDVFEKPAGVVVVDLDANSIAMSKEVRELLSKHPLPSKAAKVLKHALNILTPRVNGLDSGLDLAVEVSHIDHKATYKYDLEAVDVEIREAFLRFFATIIGHYRKCLTPLLSAPSERSRDISQLFNTSQFLKSCSSNEWPFFKLFFDTQIFSSFIEQLSFAHAENTSLVFFDECTEKVKHHPTNKLVNAVASISRQSDLPTVVSLPPDETGLPVGRTYSYPVFPTTLDPSLFNPAPVDQTPSQSKLLYNTPSVSLGSGSPMVARRTPAEKAKDRQTIEKALKSDSLWSKCLLSHVCSLWYILLPSHLSTHWNKMGVLAQALDLLEEMRLSKALPSDEVCYRILMQQCVNLGRPALAVRVYHEMKKAGIQPNAVTYGFYNKAVIEGAWPNQKRRWKVLLIVISACLFLKNLSKSEKSQSSSRSEDVFREPDFSLIGRSASVSSSRKSISALDVGLEDEYRGEMAQRTRTHKRSIFRLSSGSVAGCDYMVCGDSSYVPQTSPHWGDNKGIRRRIGGIWSSVPNQSPRKQRFNRTEASNYGDSTPSLNVELSTCSQCSSCHALLYDEQIMSGWNGDEANYKTKCPYCSSQLVASLTVTTKQSLPASLAPSSSTSSAGLAPPTTTPRGPTREPSASPSPPSPFPEEPESFSEYSGKTWPRSKKPPSADSGSPKSEGASTHYEKTSNNGSRGHVEAADLSTSTTSARLSSDISRTSPTHSSTDPLQRREKETSTKSTSGLDLSNVDLEGPQFCHRMTSLLSPTSAAESQESMLLLSSMTSGTSHTHTGSSVCTQNHVLQRDIMQMTESDTSELDTASSTGTEQLKSKSISVLEVPAKDQGADVGDHSKDEPDAGHLSAYVAKMRRIGHRRASSAPIKRDSLTSSLRQDDVFVSTETELTTKEAMERKVPPGFVTETHPPFVVPYLSPMVLRKEVESLISHDGSRILETEELVRERPIIYWNLVWYFSRLNLPTYLPLLNLWDFQKKNEELKKLSVRLQVELLWDGRFPDVREPLYLLWLGRVPRPVHLSKPGVNKRRDSESQLQSLVARVQCGDWPPVLTSLLRDRLKEGGAMELQQTLAPRSIYRETLFLNMTVPKSSVLEIDQFDREYQQHIQRLPKDLSSKLHPQDHPPSQRSVHCRRVFGLLQVK